MKRIFMIRHFFQTTDFVIHMFLWIQVLKNSCNFTEVIQQNDNNVMSCKFNDFIYYFLSRDIKFYTKIYPLGKD